MRLDATITAERQYLEEFLSYEKVEKEDSKQKHLAHFDKRMKRLLQQIGPQDSSPHAQNS